MENLEIYWNYENRTFAGFADFDGERIRFCKGTPENEGDTFDMVEQDDCDPGITLSDIWGDLEMQADENGKLDVTDIQLVALMDTTATYMKNINHEESKKMLGFHYETVIMLLSEMEKRHIIRNMDDCNNMEIHYDSKTGTTGIYVDELHFFENGRRYDRRHVLFLDEYGEIVKDVPRPIRQEMSIWILGTQFNRLFTNRTIPERSDEFRFFKIKD